MMVSLLLLSMGLAACSGTKKTTEELYAGQSAEEIYDRATVAMQKGNYSTAVKNYEALQSLYPFDQHAEQAALNIIAAYYQNSDFPATARASDSFIKIYPRSDHVDYAYYMRGVASMYQDRSVPQRYIKVDLAERDLKSSRQAFRYFGELLQLYPTTEYYDDTRQRMIYLRNLFASHEYSVANYYFQRQAYVAAAKRAQNVFQNFQQSPYVEDALVIMLKSYNELGLEYLSEKTWEVLQLNYPERAQQLSATKGQG